MNKKGKGAWSVGQGAWDWAFFAPAPCSPRPVLLAPRSYVTISPLMYWLFEITDPLALVKAM